jgi:hypothetical protein
MGTPANYSKELPARCLQLIEALWPIVEGTPVVGQEDLGPLTTTFLLAMATPIITLPVERVERYRQRSDAGYMNERPLDRRLADEVDRVLVRGSLGNAPFFREGQWRFATVPNADYNVALQFPDELHRALLNDSALKAAVRMQAQEWVSCLRNALAHGGVLYFDRDGRPSHDQQAEVLAFVSAKFADDDPHHQSPPVRLKVLQIAERDFRSFLSEWTNWVQSSGLASRLAA